MIQERTLSFSLQDSAKLVEWGDVLSTSALYVTELLEVRWLIDVLGSKNVNVKVAVSTVNHCVELYEKTADSIVGKRRQKQ